MSTVADEQHNTIQFITLKANIKIQPYLQYIFYYSFPKHTFLIVPLLHSVSDMTLSELTAYRYAALNDGDTF